MEGVCVKDGLLSVGFEHSAGLRRMLDRHRALVRDGLGPCSPGVCIICDGERR